MRVVVNGKISAFLLQVGKSQNKKIKSFCLIHLHLQKKVWRCSFSTPPNILLLRLNKKWILLLLLQ